MDRLVKMSQKVSDNTTNIEILDIISDVVDQILDQIFEHLNSIAPIRLHLCFIL